MSSDVQAKWMNSPTRAIAGTPAKRSFSQYSTALTSWLVVRSIALTRAASAGENVAGRRLQHARDVASNGATSGMRGSAANARSHATSISTRLLISANSLKCSRSAVTFPA